MQPGFDVEDCRALRSTEKALLVECDDWDEALWIPLSQITEDSEVLEEDDEGTLVVTEWFAEQRGWL